MKGRPEQAPRTDTKAAAPTIPHGEFVRLDGEMHYRIAAYDRMPPFLTSLASASDLWMFVASGGGLTAGRRDADGALFPYRTVDELHEGHFHTGPITRIRLERDGRTLVWSPFAAGDAPDEGCARNLYKNTTGNRLVFEEVRPDLGLAFRYAWTASDRYGWVRSSTLENRGEAPITVSVLDGLRNILPHGAPLAMYQQAGNLVDAYKRSELDPESGLGIYSLSAGITDRAEAIEVLRANTVWCCGLDDFRVHLDAGVIAAFAAGRLVAERSVLNGARGNYLVTARIDLEPGEFQRWHLACDVGREQRQVVELRRRILQEADLEKDLEERLRQAGGSLRRAVAAADGLQLTGQPATWVHHFANVLFNNMRGGVFADGYRLPRADFIDFVGRRNRDVARRQKQRLEALPQRPTVAELHELAAATGDRDLRRICYEYLPLHFGRRHGDPSRPWNQFSIRVRNENGEPLLAYEGNWRDIFQNWEALGTSFPDFFPSLVAKFLNASTIDGYNPYRISREGVDWEIEEPDHPWSNIGYWGDHQIIYLLKLLEHWDRHDPDGIAVLLDERVYSYANVPYRIRPYRDLLADPSATIEYDAGLEKRIAARVAKLGSDGRLVPAADERVSHANLLEKLLVPALSKLSNLIPDAGIWMNTQRPEWNDANNALAAGGVSVVTLCYLRRYLAFLARKLEGVGARELPVSLEVVEWFGAIGDVLRRETELLQGEQLDPGQRRRLLDELGGAFETYRTRVYDAGFSGTRTLSTAEAARFCRTALRWVDWGIRANRRQDGLYHAYNTMHVESDGGLRIERLPEMLEGQVAALSSGLPDPAEVSALVEVMFGSALYVPEQRSFLLYPERVLPGFLAKNRVPTARVESIPLLTDLAGKRGIAIVEQDADGQYRFAADLGNAGDLARVLDGLARSPRLKAAVERDRGAVLDLFEETFGHASYTGRSGAMYGYEGLGCIYWHMVAKLLLAVQETLAAARNAGDEQTATDLRRAYYRIRAGIGYEKTPAEYGAFPTDPYSHTPSSGGAKQPGMTGQVKEEILTRRGELGLVVDGGCAGFEPRLLRADEFVAEPATFEYFNTEGQPRSVTLARGSLAFTWCQVPVVYELNGNSTWIRVEFEDGSLAEIAGSRLDAATSRELFGRTGRIHALRVGVPAGCISS